MRLASHLALAAVALLGGAAPHALGALPQQSGVVDLLTEANLRIDGAGADDSAGYPVAGAGDVNGDGIDDVLVASFGADNNGRPDSGSAHVLFGSTSATTIDLASPGSRGFRIDGAGSDDQAGVSARAAGDVNGDGLDDVIVGAYFADHNGRADSGSAYVVFGSASTATVDLASLGSRGFRIDGPAPGDWTGRQVDAAGDVDGDGRGDLIVGALNADGNGRANSGSAYVVLGTPSPTAVDLANLGSRGFRIDGEAAGDQAGVRVAGAGDVDGDGLDDVIVGAYLADRNGRADSGSAYVVLGTPSPTAVDLASLGSRGFRIDGAAAGDWAAFSVSAAGDVDGDGNDDVIVGALVADHNGRSDSGSAYVVFGAPSPTSVDLASLGSRGFQIGGGAAGDYAGISAGGAGDVNGDGRDDVIVGAMAANGGGRPGSGAAYVVFGTPSPSAVDLASLGSAGLRIRGAAASDNAGISVAAAGDVNDDGRPDVIVGARLADENGRANSGSAYVLYGFGEPALSYGTLAGTVGQAIAPHLPTGVARTGTPSYSVSPALPAGLVLDPFTGTISGTPSVAVGATSHTVTMTDLAGSADSSFSVSVSGATDPDPPAAPAPSPPTASPAPADTISPGLSVRVPARARAGRTLPVSVRCDEDCSLAASTGTGARAKTLRSVRLRGGRWTTVLVRMPARGIARGPLTVRFAARDAAGNRTVLSRRVRLG